MTTVKQARQAATQYYNENPCVKRIMDIVSKNIESCYDISRRRRTL